MYIDGETYESRVHAQSRQQRAGVRRNEGTHATRHDKSDRVYQRVSRRSEATKRIEWDRRGGGARGRVCGQSEIRRIKGGFGVPRGRTRFAAITSFAKQSVSRGSVCAREAARMRERSGASSARRTTTREREREREREVSLEPQLVNELKTLPVSTPPHFHSRATKLRGRCTLRLLPLDDSICALAATGVQCHRSV